MVGIVEVVGLSLVPVALFAAVLHGRQILERSQTIARRLHLMSRPAPAPSGLPLERIAADLRRLRTAALSPAPGIAMAKQRGIVLAYEERLGDAARALAVPTDLAALPEGGWDRGAERLRLEDALIATGLDWHRAAR